MNKVTVTEFASMCGVSTVAIRKLITYLSPKTGQNEPKLNAIKDENGNYILSLDDEKNKSYLANKKHVSIQNNQALEQVIGYENHNIENCPKPTNDVMITLITELKNLSFEAGKAKQLENNLIEKKDDIKYWQEKYFELQNQNNLLHNQVTSLENRNRELQMQLEKKAGFLGLFKKQSYSSFIF